MEEILPGFHHWTGFDEDLRAPVHSHYIVPAGVVIDPILPEDEGFEAFEGLPEPQQVILTNHHHWRDTDRFREHFGCTVRAELRALPELEGRDVEPFGWNDDVAWNVIAVEIGAPYPEETALWIRHGPGAIAFGDELVHPGTGAPLGFPADDELGRHPDRMRDKLKHALSGLLVRDFDALLFAHGDPVPDDGKTRLRRFVEAPVERPGFGRYV